jgi:hypothetical protein
VGADTRRGWASLPSWAESGATTRLGKEIHFSFSFYQNSPQIPFLSKKNSFLGLGAKIEVVPKFLFYNFTKRSKVKIQIDFEIEI